MSLTSSTIILAISVFFVIFGLIGLFAIIHTFAQLRLPVYTPPLLQTGNLSMQNTISFSAALNQLPLIVPNSILAYVPIQISNSKGATPAPFDQMLSVPSYNYESYEAGNLQNVEFFYPNGSIIPSWLESGSSKQSSTYWLRLAKGIGAKASIIIYMGFGKTSKNFFTKTGATGESPLISSAYAAYDNGAKVFTFYVDFSGNALNLKWIGSGGYIIGNGLELPASNVLDSSVETTSNKYTPLNDILELYGTWIHPSKSNVIDFGFDSINQPSTNSLYWKAWKGSSEGSTATNTYTVFGMNFLNPITQIMGMYSVSGVAHLYITPLATESNPQVKYSTNKHVFTGKTFISIQNKAGSGVNLLVNFVRIRPYPPSGAMPNASFGSIYVVNGVSLYFSANPITYGGTGNVSVTAPGSDTIKLYLNGVLVDQNQSSLTYQLPIMSAGTYSVNALDSNTGKSIHQILQIDKASPALGLNVPQSYDSNGIALNFSANVITLNNQLNATIYVNGSLFYKLSGQSPTLSLGSNIGMYNITVNTIGNNNYTNASKSMFTAIYPNATNLKPGAIKHIVIIFQENHAFDNYFGTYPGVLGIPANACEPISLTNSLKGCIAPYLTTNVTEVNIAHTWNTSHTALNNGSMNGFVVAAKGNPQVMGYYNNETLPYYWQYARQYALDDRMFSSVLSYSDPNHWYMISANTPQIALTSGLNQNGRGIYLNESNPIPTITDELVAKNVSWKYYGIYQPPNSINDSIKSGAAFNYWNPLYSQNRTFTPAYMSHFSFFDNVFKDIANKNLADVVWVTPNWNLSEHPPANVILGMWYTTDVINHIENSSYWNSTLIVLVWDDYGGYYDQVRPPVVDANGLSFRVPAIIISPYSKQNFIDSQNYSFESTLKFIEENWNVSALDYRDRNASPLLNSLYFNQTPRKPYIIPLNNSQLNTIAPLLNESIAGNPNPNGGNTTAEIQNMTDKGNQGTTILNSTQQLIDVNGYLLNASDFDT